MATKAEINAVYAAGFTSVASKAAPAASAAPAAA